MSRQTEAKLKKMRKYAEEREKKHSANMISKDYSTEIAKRYQETLDNIVKDIESFYSIYADKEKITISEAKKRASNLDVQAFSRKAKKYVETKDFSEKANEELRLYNMTMKVNRLELLKNNIILELIALSDGTDKHYNKLLTQEALEEIKRQAGILGKTAWHDPEMVKQILDASFYNATFSERIWANQDVLKSLIDQQLTRGILQGINPKVMASKVRELFSSTQKEAERLLITESARVQTGIQKATFSKYGYKEYDFIAEPGACPVCSKTAKKGPYKVKDMTSGINASPMHPYCRCSVAASFEQDDQTKEELKKEGYK